MSQADFDADLSQLSSKTFITSLGDDELVELINRLSQRSKIFQQGTDKEAHEEVHSSEEVFPDILPPSIPSLNHTDDSRAPDSTLSLPLAQQQPSLGASAEQDDDAPDNLVFGDYNSYFATKGRNQQLEDDKYLEWDRKRRHVQGLDDQQSTIFAGCVIYVNGHTRPSIATIHKLVILHGGKFIHHLSSKGAATHVIAERLTPRKQLEFKNYKVVRPEWITESIDKGQVQRWHKYSVINTDYGQVQLPFAQRDDHFNEDGETDDDGNHSNGGSGDYNVEDEDDDEEGNNQLKPLTQSQEPEPAITDEVGVTVDSKHPDFLRTFFAKSRLHHLSTWKADLRAEFLSKAMEQSKLTQKTHKRKPNNGLKLIMHVDFDCFFATASALNHPEIDFKNIPVCVSHGGSSASSNADIASCNYVCRKFGVRNGMWVGSAKKICPELVCLDYDFPTYERISKEFYQILMDLEPDCILPVSIDEALLEITSFIEDGENLVQQTTEFANKLREKIFTKTKCSASIGISSNVLLAKLSLRKAKPDGFFFLHDDIQNFLNEIEVRDLPGVGGSIVQKLMNELFSPNSTMKPRVRDIRTLDLTKLEKIFGHKTGQKLHEYSKGIDYTSIDISKDPHQFLRKSVSIDINWGIRFDEISQIDNFLLNVAKEIVSKLKKINMVTAQVSLKLLKRAPHAPVDPPKYLGCGECDSFSKSSKLGVPTDDSRIIGTEARALFRHIGCDPKELRGVSIQVTKLTEKKKDDQKRLPFSKVDFQTYKKQKLERETREQANEVDDQSDHSKINVDATQYDIPTDVDSSVLEQLPSFVKQEIRKQKNKNMEPVSMVPKDVDLDVFQQLPHDIQEELRVELRRRNIQINPRTPSKNRKVYLQQVFAPNGNTEYVRVVSPGKSPTAKRKLRSPSRSPEKFMPGHQLPPPPPSPMRIDELDEAVLNELPSSVRDNIIEEWQAYEESKKTEYERFKEKIPVLKRGEEIGELSIADFTRLREPISFQRRSRPKEVLELVDTWIVKTKTKGPHVKDLNIFESFMKNLKRYNLNLYLNVTQRMSIVMRSESDVCDKWVHVLDNLS